MTLSIGCIGELYAANKRCWESNGLFGHKAVRRDFFTWRSLIKINLQVTSSLLYTMTPEQPVDFNKQYASEAAWSNSEKFYAE